MAYSFNHWSQLHTYNAQQLRDRWLANPEKNFHDGLVENGRYSAQGVWTVTSEIELVRLIGALQWHNPTMKLWYRGEKQYYATALPLRARVGSADQQKTVVGLKWLETHAHVDRTIRDRSPLARVAILQHYGCPTSFLDISASYEAACAFAFSTQISGQSHLRLYALPRHQAAVTVLDNADLVIVDLHAELPSYCMRPHVQQAAFVARREAACRDLTGEDCVPPQEAALDPLCIAHIRLDFDGRKRFYEPRQAARTVYPPAGSGCRLCGDHSADMKGDYLLHLLKCLVKIHGGAPAGFPDTLSD